MLKLQKKLTWYILNYKRKGMSKQGVMQVIKKSLYFRIFLIFGLNVTRNGDIIIFISKIFV